MEVLCRPWWPYYRLQLKIINFLDTYTYTGDGKDRIFCGDVGQNNFEEIDLIEKGANYGWNIYEGSECFISKNCSRRCKNISKRRSRLIDVDILDNQTSPINEYNHKIGLSVTGGIVYRGCQSPNLQGHYIFGDWFTG